MDFPATVQPWPRIKTQVPPPTARAKSRPIGMSDTSKSVSPNFSCASQTGTSWPIVAQLCTTGLSFSSVMAYGITLQRHELDCARVNHSASKTTRELRARHRIWARVRENTSRQHDKARVSL